MRIYYPNARAVLSLVLSGQGVGSDSDPFIVPVTPSGATIHRNPYRQADGWSLEFDAADLPVPPQSIRTGQVEIYLYGSDGLEDPKRNITKGRSPTAVGLFDKASLSYDDDTRELSIDGQDYTALFLAKKWPLEQRVPAGRSLSRTLEEMIGEVDRNHRLSLDYQSKDDPTIGKGDTRRIKRRGWTPKNAESYWDVITDICGRYGLIVFLEDLRVVVTTPRERIETTDPRYRRLAWGRSLDSLEITRNMGKERTPVIKVVSWDEDAQLTREGVYPDSKVQITKRAKTSRGKDKGRRVAAGAVPYGVGTDFDDVLVYTVAGLTDVEHCKRAARTIYDLKARGECEMSIATCNLTDDADLDLIDLRSGDPLAITFDPFNQNEIRVLNEGQRFEYLTDRGFGPKVSRAIAANVDLLLAIRKPFRVKEATIGFESGDEGGITVSAEIQEFVSLRDPEQPPILPPFGLARI